jgi:hypothetical protein
MDSICILDGGNNECIENFGGNPLAKMLLE